MSRLRFRFFAVPAVLVQVCSMAGAQAGEGPNQYLIKEVWYKISPSEEALKGPLKDLDPKRGGVVKFSNESIENGFIGMCNAKRISAPSIRTLANSGMAVSIGGPSGTQVEYIRESGKILESPVPKFQVQFSTASVSGNDKFPLDGDYKPLFKGDLIPTGMWGNEHEGLGFVTPSLDGTQYLVIHHISIFGDFHADSAKV